ncbi:UNKNOWN [Stylonychia lemnae]|uniref:AMP-activated protein kinase glycogen-binding domain-containing protein n=1 Tax=Stylonychia lemnae TaxID=5949 RepID=A0A078B4K1_STYLE|nr:UNKNOWN [Stylonychia lemnae]|eukprot:CDW89374.1 UNKNOWN [Stylonychia lemnae]
MQLRCCKQQKLRGFKLTHLPQKFQHFRVQWIYSGRKMKNQKKDQSMPKEERNKLRKDQEMEDQSQQNKDISSVFQQKMVSATFAFYYDYPVGIDTPVYIMGEFNKWEPAMMERVADQIFYYETKVLSGYKYRFNFNVGGSIATDSYQDREQDQNDQYVNFKYIVKSAESDEVNETKIDPLILQKLPLFVHPELKPVREEDLKQIQLKDAELEETTAHVTNEVLQNLQNDDDGAKIQILSLLLRRNRYVLSKLENLRKIRKFAEASTNSEVIQSSSEQTSNFEEENLKIAKAIKFLIRSRIARSINQSEYYYINSFRGDTNELVLRRVYDNSGILLNDNQASEFNVVNANESYFLESFQVLSKEDERQFRNDLINNKAHTLLIRYKVNITDYGYYQSKECQPVELQPQLPIDQYTYNIDQSNYFVYRVSRGEYGEVKNEAYRVEEEARNAQDRYLQFYTNEVASNILNIFHMHIDDTSEQVAYEAYYLNENQSTQDFIDFSGSNINYKIFVKDQRIHGVLYQKGSEPAKELRFYEYRFNKGTYANVDYSNKLEYSTENLLAQVVEIPIGILVSQDQNVAANYPQVQLQHNPYGFCALRCLHQSLGGYVDVNVLSVDSGESLLESQEKIALPPCLMNDPQWDKKEKYISKLQLDDWTPIDITQN